ncbi:MAG TPA: transcription elongation factor GreA [Nitrospiria bacterium]
MKIPITKNGYEQLLKDLERLKRVERPKVIEAIAEARAHGDLSENAEYAAAKERQSFVEGKIQNLENKISEAQIIDTKNLSNEKVVFGTTVVLKNTETDEKKRFTLVGQEEADIKKGEISVQSPVGKALIGHKVGDWVTIVTPSKTVEYEILEIGFDRS